MAGETIYMAAGKKNSLQDIHKRIHSIKGAEQVCKSEQTINGVVIMTLVYEKYYLRTGGYTSATVVLTEYGQEQTATVISSGGGTGVLNLSLGSNSKFAEECVQILESCGFGMINSDSEMKDQGFTARFLK